MPKKFAFFKRPTRSGVIAAAALLLLICIVVVVAVRKTRSTDYGGYSLEELGVPAAVDTRLKSKTPWLEYRDLAEQEQAAGVRRAEIIAMTGHERERAWFELGIKSVLGDAVESLDGELDWYRGTLAREWWHSMDQCARDRGYGGGFDDFSDIPAEVGDDWPEHDEQLVDDRQQCARWASTYPGLDVDHRDRLLTQTEQRLLDAVEAWIRRDPRVVVPVEWHPGAPEPLADLVRERCRATDNPTECEREAGVEKNE